MVGFWCFWVVQLDGEVSGGCWVYGTKWAF